MPSFTTLLIFTLQTLLSLTFAMTPSNATIAACNTTSTIKTPYPTRCQIGQIFDSLQAGNFTTFFQHLSPTVHWNLMGTHPLAGLYTNKTIFAEDALQRLSNTLDASKGSKLEVTNLVGGGDNEWSTVELHATATAKNGLYYDNMFSWTMRWSTDAIIQETHAYFDSALVTKILLENEVVVYTYHDARDVLQVGPMGANCKSGV